MIRAALARHEQAFVLLVGLLALAGVAAGLCGLALWLVPTAPPWAVKLVVLGGALALGCLGGFRIKGILWLGIAGILKRGKETR